jgi:hypothetical protein
MIKRPEFKDLEWMIAWPKGTKGYAQEADAIYKLLELCDKIGFGRLPQMLDLITDTWNGKDMTVQKKSYIKHNKETFKLMAEINEIKVAKPIKPKKA